MALNLEKNNPPVSRRKEHRELFRIKTVVGEHWSVHESKTRGRENNSEHRKRETGLSSFP